MEEEYNPYWLENFFNQEEFDWTHSNSIDFDEQDSIVYVSLRNLSRIIAIDYNTKEIIWNLGDPDFMIEPSFTNNFNFSHQHSAQIYNESLLLFDNGRFNNPELSRCLEFSFDNNQVAQLEWEHILPDSLLTLSRGECDRLINNNTLITAGRTGNVLEVNSSNEIVWHLNVKTTNNENVSIYRSERINHLFPSIFSFELNNLKGSYLTQSYYIDFNSSISGFIYNQGWHPQRYYYLLLDEEENQISSNYIDIDSNSIGDIIINIENLDIAYNQQYKMRIIPEINPSLFQQIEFSLNHFFLGDINTDSIVNILDLIELVNIVKIQNLTMMQILIMMA